jgi:hypothetical protein
MQKVQLGVQLASLAILNCKSGISELTNRTSNLSHSRRCRAPQWKDTLEGMPVQKGRLMFIHQGMEVNNPSSHSNKPI